MARLTSRVPTFVVGALCGAALALLLTQPIQSRQASTPRPAVVTPLAIGIGAMGTPAADRGADPPAPRPPAPAVAASPTPRPPAEPAPLESDLRAGGRPAPPTPGATASPDPTKRPVRPVEPRRGAASWVAASYGATYLAARLPRGTRLSICGPAGCVNRTVTDYGPSKRIHPERVVDLSRADFAVVCGDPAMGVCRVAVTRR